MLNELKTALHEVDTIKEYNGSKPVDYKQEDGAMVTMSPKLGGRRMEETKMILGSYFGIDNTLSD